MSQPTSRGAAVTKPELPFPRSDSPRMARLRTPRRDPGRGGRRHQQPETLPMPNQLALLTTPSSLRVLYPRRRVTRRLAPRCVQSHKNRLAPALGLEIPRLTPADSPSWSCTVGDREDPPSTTPDHLPNPPDRSHSQGCLNLILLYSYSKMHPKGSIFRVRFWRLAAQASVAPASIFRVQNVRWWV